MQRIAWVVCAFIVTFSGCAKNAEVTTRPPPPPLLATRNAVARHVTPARTPRPAAIVHRSRPCQAIEPDWIPAGGIKRDKWDVIVVHHSAAPTATPKGMDNYHRNERKWKNGLGYHFVIGNGVNTPDGRIYVGSRWKRQITGAHCKAKSGRYFGVRRPNNFFNAHGVGICLIGHYDHSRPSKKQLAALERLVAFLCDHARINPSNIYGHGEVTHKTACPGKYLARELAQVRASVNQTIVAGQH